MTERFVPPEVIADRFERLKVVLERSALALARETGRTTRRGSRRRDLEAGSCRASGRTRQGKLVHFAGPTDADIAAGSYAPVLVTGAAPHFLRGELIGVTQLHKHKKQPVQIPLRVTGDVPVPSADAAVGGPAAVA